MKPRVYIETTIPSYLTSRPNRDIIIAGHQQVTHRWWEERRDEFELYISQLVIDECQAGDREMARKRLGLIDGIKALQLDFPARDLARKLIAKGLLPTKAEADAFHVAIAAANAMDYLLTWNLRHIANAFMKKGIEEVCRESGFEPPVICTPDTLLAEEEGYVEG